MGPTSTQALDEPGYCGKISTRRSETWRQSCFLQKGVVNPRCASSNLSDHVRSSGIADKVGLRVGLADASLCLGDEGFDPGYILGAGGGFDAAGYVHAEGADGGDGVGYVFWG